MPEGSWEAWGLSAAVGPLAMAPGMTEQAPFCLSVPTLELGLDGMPLLSCEMGFSSPLH